MIVDFSNNICLEYNIVYLTLEKKEISIFPSSMSSIFANVVKLINFKCEYSAQIVQIIQYLYNQLRYS